MRTVETAIELVDSSLVDIEADHVEPCLGKSDSNRQPHITQTDNRDAAPQALLAHKTTPNV